MANDDLTISAGFEDNASEGVKKLGKNVEDASQKVSGLANVAKGATKSLQAYSEAAGQLGKANTDASKSATTLSEALKKTGVAALNSFNKIDLGQLRKEFAQLSSGEIQRLTVLLREAGISLSRFLDGEKIYDTDLGLVFSNAVVELNKLQNQFDKPLSIEADFQSVEDVFAASRNLLRDVRAEARQFLQDLTDESTSARLARQFEPIYELRRTLAGGSFGQFEALFDFQKVQQEADSLVANVERLRNSLIEIGPAAATGNEEAVAEFLRLKRGLNDAEQSAIDLNQRLREAGDVALRDIAGTNASLGALGFEPITLEDIFPSSEQQKVAQLQQKIDQAVRNSVQEGAVKRTLNFFLAQDKALESVDRNVVSLTSHLPRLRYALYDVSNTATIFGAAIIAGIGATVKFAADYERAFADVIRTTGVVDGEIAKLRNDLIDLSQILPVGFSQLAEIATLAGQLNIANDVIGDFTETVAKFAATTDVTIEASATAFGRLDQLVDGVNGQFNKLGSSILKVGVNAVATESDIINIATQIASVANIAGFSASELIGFSSALASVGTRPELARGTFTRLFTEIQQAVGGGGDQLETFARVAGQSVDEFTAAWGAGSGADQVIAILRGLESAGTQADQVLAQLGITSVRDVPTLLKLAQSIGEVENQINLAKIGFDEGTELQEQYGVITATLSERLEVLKNNFGAVLAALGSLAGPISGVVDALNSVLRVIEAIITNDFGRFVAGSAAAFGALLGVSALAVGALARFGGSAAGAGTAMIELFETITFTKIQVDQLTNSTGNATLAQLRKVAVDKQAIAAEQKRTVSTLRQNAVTQQSVVSTLRYNVALGTQRARLIALRAGLDSYIARVRLAGAVSLNAAKQTRLWGLAVTSLKTALGLGVLTVLIAGIEKAIESFQNLNEETKSAEERFEDWGSILEAVKQDSRDFANATEETAGEFTVIGKSSVGAADEISNYSRVLAATNGEEEALANLLDESSGAFDRQTIAIGKNTRAILAQRLARELAAAAQPGGFGEFAASGVESIRQTFSFGLAGESELSQSFRALDVLISTFGTDVSVSLREAGFSYEQWSDAVLSGNQELADSIANRLGPAAQKLSESLAEEDAVKYAEEIEKLNILARFGSDALIEFAGTNDQVAAAIREAKIEIETTGGVYEEAEEDVKSFQETLKSSVDEMYASVNAERAMADAITNLGAVFFNEGSQIAATSMEMQAAINGIIGAASNEEEAVAGLTGFYNAIVEGGYASQEQLEILKDVIIETYRTAATAQIALLRDQRAALEISSEIERSRASGRGNYARAAAQNKEYAAITKQIEALEKSRESIDSIAEATGNSAESANLLAKGYDNARKSAAGARNEVEEIEEETKQAVRTLLDYGSDLESVFSRAFDLRFARRLSLDDLADAWDSFSNQVDDAKNSLQELLATQEDLGADRSIKEYFLSVAEAYNDQLRAAKLRAEIAELDIKQAKAARELAEAQQATEGATSLTGEGPGARQNRQALLGLVQNYQDYITVLAESGASQDELRAATERARQEFIQQATELGFAEQDVLMYAAAFDDVRTAIDRVPRNITIDFNADPALQALNELNAKLDESIRKTKELNSLGGQGGRNIVQQVVQLTPKEIAQNNLNATRAQLASINTQIGALRNTGNDTIVRALEKQRNQLADAARWEAKAVAFSGMNGGYTGPGAKTEVAGIVHRGEYVVPKKYVNQSTRLPDPSFLAQLQNGTRGYQMGGFVGGSAMGSDGTVMVELSPYDRKLLADAGNVQLRLNGRVVAEATNQNNFNQARRGSD